MRCHDKSLDDDEAEMWLHDAGPIREMVQCSSCERIQIAPDGDHIDPDPTCLGCGKHFVYRPYWSW